ncbi:MAG: hypothetical protein WCQ99_14910 [Pseudomonadota bacterium]
MKKINMIHITMAIIFTLFITLSAVQDSDAQPGRGFSGGTRGPNPFMRCIHMLTVSSDTMIKIETIHQAQKETMKADRDVMMAAMDTYYAALTAPNQDSTALALAQQSITALEQKHAEVRFALESSIVSLLSAAETEQLGECLASALPDPPIGDNDTKRKHGSR